jgi:large subunit ribosomal protein L6
MSRIGKREVPVPPGTTVTIDGATVTVQGKLGTLSRTLHPRIRVEQDGAVLRVLRASDDKPDRQLHGLSRTLVANMIEGVNTGFTRALEIQGVGYRVELKKNALLFNIGYSHPVDFPLPETVKAEVEKNVIRISGSDKELIGQLAANIRAIRKPDPYKGKGIRYQGERIKLKPGKSGAK